MPEIQLFKMELNQPLQEKPPPGPQIDFVRRLLIGLLPPDERRFTASGIVAHSFPKASDPVFYEAQGNTLRTWIHEKKIQPDNEDPKTKVRDLKPSGAKQPRMWSRATLIDYIPQLAHTELFHFNLIIKQLCDRFPSTTFWFEVESKEIRLRDKSGQLFKTFRPFDTSGKVVHPPEMIFAQVVSHSGDCLNKSDKPTPEDGSSSSPAAFGQSPVPDSASVSKRWALNRIGVAAVLLIGLGVGLLVTSFKSTSENTSQTDQETQAVYDSLLGITPFYSNNDLADTWNASANQKQAEALMLFYASSD